MTTSDELDLVPSEDLVEALARRFDATLFAATKDRGDGMDVRPLVVQGSPVVCLGLAHLAARSIEGRLVDEEGEE